MAATRRVPTIWRNPRTGGFYYRRHMPKHLQAILGKEARRSLHTHDIGEAKQRYPEMAATVQAEIDRAQVEHSARLELDRQAAETDLIVDREQAFLATLSPSQRALFYRVEWGKAHGKPVEVEPGEALDAMVIGELAGDVGASPDVPPEVSPKPTHKGKRKGAVVTFDSLVDTWSAERRPAARTVYAWRKKMGRLATFIGHDDASRIGKADVLAYRDHLLQSKAPKTVSEAVTIIRVLYKAAIDNDRLAMDNPAATVKVTARQDQLEKVRPYRDTEAAAILKLARDKPKRSPSLRWLPALLAWTGARIDELAGLRVCDIRDDNDHGPYLDLVPHTMRPLKNDGSARRIPLPANVEDIQAFLGEFVEGRRKAIGPDSEALLFHDVSLDKNGRPGPNASNRIAWMVRKGAKIIDPRIQPAHSFRHRFKDKLREAGIEGSIQDALLGHTTAGEGAKYGAGYSLAVLRQAIDKLS